MTHLPRVCPCISHGTSSSALSVTTSIYNKYRRDNTMKKGRVSKNKKGLSEQAVMKAKIRVINIKNVTHINNHGKVESSKNNKII